MACERAGRRVVDRALAAGRARDERATDPVADPARGRRIRPGAARLCDLCHRWTSLVGIITILLGQKRGRVSGSGQPNG